MIRICVIVLAVVVIVQATLVRRVTNTYTWKKQGLPQPDTLVDVVFALRHSDEQAVEKLFWEVSDPESDNYGQYLSYEELNEYVHNEKAVEAVKNVLSYVDTKSIEVSYHGEFISVIMTVRDVEWLLNTQFYEFYSPIYDTVIVKALGYVIPDILLTYVTHIGDVTYFPTDQGHMLDSWSCTDDCTTPDRIASLYGIDTETSGLATQSVFETQGYSFSQDDLNAFSQHFNLSPGSLSSLGPNRPELCNHTTTLCQEPNLDLQYMTAIAQNAPTTVWAISTISKDPFLDWVVALANTSDAPLVHSISYGGYEYDGDAMNMFNTELQKLALRGITVVVSSGDDGVANFAARAGSMLCGYNPAFPASSPFVTTVGATQIVDGEEVACSAKSGGVITSGGGFSTVFSRPSYQNDVVEEYLMNMNDTLVEGFDRSGRAYPDVSIIGHNYIVMNVGEWTVTSGTSASAPVFAAMITIINDRRLQDNMQPLGFLNPRLYGLGETTWSDVVEGDNHCAAAATGKDPVCCTQGFEATTGWDPVSGLGTPRFENLLKALLT